MVLDMSQVSAQSKEASFVNLADVSLGTHCTCITLLRPHNTLIRCL